MHFFYFKKGFIKKVLWKSFLKEDWVKVSALSCCRGVIKRLKSMKKVDLHIQCTLKAYQLFPSEKSTSEQVELNSDLTIVWLLNWSNGVRERYLPHPYSTGKKSTYRWKKNDPFINDPLTVSTLYWSVNFVSNVKKKSYGKGQAWVTLLITCLKIWLKLK